MCIDYTYLNKECPKDSFALPHINQLIDATIGHELLSFLDAYSGYNQLRMDLEDQEKKLCIMEKRTYYYNILLFGLKNARATYERLVNTMFKDYIQKSCEVYIPDMLVRSLQVEDHVDQLKETFTTLRK